MQKTKIDWTDMSWNPVTGCLHNCNFCYARAMYHRFKRSFKPAFHPERLDEPTHIKNPKKIFVCSVADLFGHWVPQEWIDKVMIIVENCNHHIFQFLTKNPIRLPSINFPENSWVGVTANDQQMLDKAIKYLSLTKANIKFISAEPLHSKIIINQHEIDWLIVGAQTGIRPMQPDKKWVDSIVEETRKLKIPLFFKENLKYQPFFTEWPEIKHKQLFFV